jgi:hypothetical protein
MKREEVPSMMSNLRPTFGINVGIRTVECSAPMESLRQVSALSSMKHIPMVYLKEFSLSDSR